MALRIDRIRYVAAVMSFANGGLFTPVQLQKILFILDQEIPEEIGGPHFDFRPYDYGPFDSQVYSVVDDLCAGGFAQKVAQPGVAWYSYRLSEAGQDDGRNALLRLTSRARSYVEDVVKFARSHTFSELVSAVYKAYPEMKVNSVFKQ